MAVVRKRWRRSTCDPFTSSFHATARYRENMADKPSFAEALLTWFALPVYVWQGLGVRKRIDRMTPPPHDGDLVFGGEGEPLKLLVLGDSSAAGVGVEKIEDCFAGHLPRILAERTGRPVTA